ncbi:hypothetical protein EXIGLDRAFT_828447 [Exidia glandulosa HHB12029]|uniref:F-box domain-containing protein n=1 Tax=Exidia glandulosa HHB12029 TaxID=1314781 RepID=A0A165QGF4_EXIGL|nr:hypothetical protein EXIGLDRAFT_828447 [Exidia glandulosa HHB12029]
MTVPAASQTAGLPVEILSLILTEVVTLRDIIQCSHVCKCWRTLAHSRSLLFSEITVSNEKNGSHLHQRLAVSSRPLRISVYETVYGPSVLADVVIPQIASNLHRLESLYVSIHYLTTLDNIMRALQQPVPILRHLYMRIHRAGRHNTFVLPHGATIFAGYAPMLSCLRLENIYLPPEQIPAFSRVNALCVIVGHDVPEHAFHNLLRTCPAIRTLALLWPDEIMFPVTPTTNCHQLPILENVWLLCDHEAPVSVSSTIRILNALSAPATMTVSASVDATSISALGSLLLRQLPAGSLCLLFSHQDVYNPLTMTFAHATSDLRRTFSIMDDSQQWNVTRGAHLVMQQLHLHGRITELETPIWHYTHAASLGVLPSLHTLVLYVHGGGILGYKEESWPDQTLYPALKKLVLALERQPVRESIEDVSEVIVLVDALRLAAHVELELRGVSLSGDVNRLCGHFSRIVTVPLTRSQPLGPFPDFYSIDVKHVSD